MTFIVAMRIFYKEIKKTCNITICAYIDSNRFRFSEWAVGFRYGNFFVPRVVKNLKISPWERKTYLPQAYGPWKESFSSRGLIFGGFFNPLDEEISITDTRLI